MGKFKKGDKVIVNPTLKERNVYGKLGFLPVMKIPGIYTISAITLEGNYNLEGRGYCYSEEMLLSVPLFKEGDTVIIRKNLKGITEFPYGLTSTMEQFEGKVYTIRKSYRTTDIDISKDILGFDGCTYKLEGDPNDYSWPSVAFDLSNYKLKNKNYESRLQEQESPLRRGSREISSGVCCRINRARIEIGSLSYKKVLGRG